MEVVSTSGVSDFDNASVSIGHAEPLVAECESVNPFAVYQGVEVEVPAFTFVCAFDPIEATSPVAGEGAAAESCEPCAELADVTGRQVWNVLDGQGYVFRLAYLVGPP